MVTKNRTESLPSMIRWMLANSHKLLVAIMVRLGDPDWIAEMVEAAEAARKSASYH